MELTPDVESDSEISERLDKMWAEHILACLAIINAYTGENKE